MSSEESDNPVSPEGTLEGGVTGSREVAGDEGHRVGMEEVGKISLEVLGLVPINSNCVLHLWSGRGALALKLRLRNPSISVTCVDVLEEPTESSTRFANEVYRADPEFLLNEKASEWVGRFDVVVLDSGWEGCRDPQSFLAAAALLVGESGMVLVRQRNGSNWWVIADLLSGNWTADVAGRVSRGPYHSAGSIRAWLEGAALKVDVTVGRKGSRPLPEFSRAVGMDASSPDLLLEERVWRGVKGAMSERLHVSFFSGGAKGMEMRIRSWIAAFATLPGVSVSVFEGRMQLPKVAAGVMKVLVLHRFYPRAVEECERMRAELRKQGWVVVFDLDERFSDVPRSFWNGEEPPSGEVLKYCDGVQSVTSKLMEMAEVGAAETQIFAEGLLELPVMLPRDAMRPLVYVAGDSLEENSPWLVELGEVLRSCPEAEVLVVGNRRVFDGIDASNKRFEEACEGADLMGLVGQCSIAVLGAADRGEVYSGGRAFVRAASLGLACIAAGSVYGDTIKHGETGVIAGSARGFSEALTILIKERVRRAVMAKAAREWVGEQRMLSRSVAKQVEWYRELARKVGS